MTTVAAWLLGACLALPETPAIAIIIDDLGNRLAEDRAAVSLPGPLAYGILPFTPHAEALALRANEAGKEVLLHLPMEADADNHLLGPGALDSTMPRPDFVEAVRRALDGVPHLVGVNNHMGSRLTRDSLRMGWLMDELGARGTLLYVDSRTTAHTVARRAARRASVPYLSRDVFLDNELDATYISAQFDALVEHAQMRGTGVGIAHPHPETTAVLFERLGALEGVRLVPLSRLGEERACDDRRHARGGQEPARLR